MMLKMKIFKLLFKRSTLVLFSILIQIMWFVLQIAKFSQYYIGLNYLFTLLSVLIVLAIIKRERHIDMKLPWIIVILVFPLFGGILYIFAGATLYSSPSLKKINKTREKANKTLKQDENVLNEIKELDRNIYSQTKYISKYVGYPIYNNSKIEYWNSGEETYQNMLTELEKAEKFIFIEFFIISEGKMWQGILDILKEKVKQGVDVRVIYDDIGSIGGLPNNYYRILRKMGIKSIAFNRLVPIMALFMNNRDHRKIMVIDGNTAFSGGLNIADEYINEKERFGYWKDNGIMIKGEAVWNFTNMFLEIWNAFTNEDEEFIKFKPTCTKINDCNGFISPYGENPLDDEIVGENIYLNIINQAQNYVYIFTPYLIIDTEMITALTLARKRGVDIRIVTPGIPDKKIVFTLTRSYYEMLIKDGVKIYEYTPGFIHSKVFVSDDKVATVGTLNLDYRSLYLHFECGTYIYNSNVITKIKEDATQTIQKSREVKMRDCKVGIIKSLFQSILRIFAPLM